jgi:hypothetical protein
MLKNGLLTYLFDRIGTTSRTWPYSNLSRINHLEVTTISPLFLAQLNTSAKIPPTRKNRLNQRCCIQVNCDITPPQVQGTDPK